MPQGRAFLLGRGWSDTGALEGNIREESHEPVSLRQREGLPAADSAGRVQSRAGQPWVAFVPFIRAVSLSCTLLLALRRGLLVTVYGSALEFMPQKAGKLQLQSHCSYFGISSQCSLISSLYRNTEKQKSLIWIS